MLDVKRRDAPLGEVRHQFTQTAKTPLLQRDQATECRQASAARTCSPWRLGGLILGAESWQEKIVSPRNGSVLGATGPPLSGRR
ncbi:MAG: hypothetical protein ACIALR_04545, partial [Blastopirellula sp. JB062]